MLNQTSLQEFKNMYQEEFGILLNESQTLECATRLIGLVKAIYGDNLPKLKGLDTKANQPDY